MQTTLKKWGNGTGVRFTKELLLALGLSVDDTLSVDIVDGRIVLTPQFRHLSLKERAAAYGGKLNLSEEFERDEPVGSEVW